MAPIAKSHPEELNTAFVNSNRSFEETIIATRQIAFFCVAMFVSGNLTLNSNLIASPPRYVVPFQQNQAATRQTAPPVAKASTYEVSYTTGIARERRGLDECVDWYAQAAAQIWQTMEANRFAALQTADQPRELELYHLSVAKLIESAQKFGKFDPSHGITLSSGSVLPIRFSAMEFSSSEISRIDVVGRYKTPDQTRRKAQNGVGVPIICHVKTQRKFMEPESTIVATAVLRSSIAQPEGFWLEIVNSRSIREIPAGQEYVPLSVDLTAALAYTKSLTRETAGIHALFKTAELDGKSGLKMIEPYQPGKIPVVLIHGFASGPVTWGSMLNDISVHRDILERYQFWTFYYPTGKPFPAEAANLRQQLLEIREYFDPEHADAALDNMVIIGHSLGGLVAKMQITESQSRLIESMSKVPIEELRLDPQSRAELSRLFQFSPPKQISRVVFIGTPHHGTKRASNLASHVTTRLIRQPRDLQNAFDELRKNNEDLLTSKPARTPTSLDLLRPGNPLLDALYELPVAPRIRMHSIIGVGHKERFGKEIGDGVVLVSSAQHRGVLSEILVDDGHSMQKHPQAIEEVIRILRVHMDEVDHIVEVGQNPEVQIR